MFPATRCGGGILRLTGCQKTGHEELDSSTEAIRSLKALNADLDVIDELGRMTPDDRAITSRFIQEHTRLYHAR